MISERSRTALASRKLYEAKLGNPTSAGRAAAAGRGFKPGRQIGLPSAPDR